MAKVALLIGVSEYEPGLNPLPGSVLDVDALKRVLSHPEMGGFAEADITTLKNPQRQEMEEAIYRLFADRKKDDLLLLYFSGHGIKDENGRLYLATRTTRKENGRLVNPSAVAASYLHDRINDSSSHRQVIILDCCFSGAIAQGMTVKDDGLVDLQASLGGRGRAILTSSTSIEYSFGANGIGHRDKKLSVYTHYLVKGIETGTADIDGDGYISVEELHEYVSGQVKKAALAMTPKFYPVEEGYKIILAKSPCLKKNIRICTPQKSFYRKTKKIRPLTILGVVIAASIGGAVAFPYLLPSDKRSFPPINQSPPTLTLANSAEDFSKGGLEKYNKADYQGAIADYNEAIRLQPDLANAYKSRGNAKYRLGDKQGAIQDYNEAIRLQPDFANAYSNRGIAKSDLGDKQGAIVDYNEAIRLQPDLAATYSNRGNAKYRLGDKQGAIVDYNEAIRLQPDFANAYSNRGIAKSDLGDKQGAIQDYNEAIRLQPDLANAYSNRGITKFDLGDKQGAIVDYREAARLYQQQGKTDDYRNTLNQIEKLEKKS
jgi:tetratricopeptide (TPR) repeat protein